MNSELHNPDNLTPEQYGAADGWRLLNSDENGRDVNPRKRCDEVGVFEAWRNGAWTQGSLNGLAGDATYRTRLTPAELRAARGIPEQPVSDTPIKASTKAEWDDYKEGALARTSRECGELRQQLAAAQRENAELRERNTFLEQFTPKTNLALCAELLEAKAQTEAAEAERDKLRERIIKSDTRNSNLAESVRQIGDHSNRALARAEAAEAKIRSMQEASGRSEPNP